MCVNVWKHSNMCVTAQQRTRSNGQQHVWMHSNDQSNQPHSIVWVHSNVCKRTATPKATNRTATCECTNSRTAMTKVAHSNEQQHVWTHSSMIATLRKRVLSAQQYVNAHQLHSNMWTHMLSNMINQTCHRACGISHHLACQAFQVCLGQVE